MNDQNTPFTDVAYSELTQDDKDFLEKKCTPENFFDLLKALTFYADCDSYYAMSIIADRPCGEFADDYSDVNIIDDNDETVETRTSPGKRARDMISDIFSDLL
jgi:hypothetical protein